MVGKGKKDPVKFFEESIAYVTLVKKAFRNEPAKFEQFLKIMNGIQDKRIDPPSAIAMVKELFKDHKELFRGFQMFIPDDYVEPISPEAEQEITSMLDFMRKLEERFSPFVCEYFWNIFEGNMSDNEVLAEVEALFEGHEDLFREFCNIFG